MDILFISLQSTDPGLLLREPTLYQVPEHATIEEALQTIGIGAEQVAHLLRQRALTIFGVTVMAGQRLYPNDRIELLDQLRFDPMESRRRRARHSKIQKDCLKQLSRQSLLK